LTGEWELQLISRHQALPAGCTSSEYCATYLRQEGIEPQNQLNVAIEQHFDLVDDSFSVDPAENECYVQFKQKE